MWMRGNEASPLSHRLAVQAFRPFAARPTDDHAAQLAAMEGGPPPLPLPLDDSLLEALRAGLDPDPAGRPSARELLAVW